MMTDKLREAALMAVDALDSDDPTIQLRAAMNLRAALAEPAQKPMHPEMKKMYEDYFDRCFRESSAPQRREWIGLTDADFEKEKFVDYNFMAGASFAEAKLKDKNCG
jgi:hypothetical protein